MKLYTKKRMYVRLRKLGRVFKSMSEEKEPKLSDIQILSIRIIRKIIAQPTSILLIDPLEHYQYVQYKDYYIKFGATSATITNGKFSYYIQLPYITGNKLVMFFNRHVSKRRQAMDMTYNTNTLKSMNQMLRNI